MKDFTMVLLARYVFQMTNIYQSRKRNNEKKKKNKIKIKIHLFVNNFQIIPIWRIVFLFLFPRFKIHKLFLFLFIQKFAPQITSYWFCLKNKYSLNTDPRTKRMSLLQGVGLDKLRQGHGCLTKFVILFQNGLVACKLPL